jgi:hypothetical protein
LFGCDHILHHSSSQVRLCFVVVVPTPSSSSAYAILHAIQMTWDMEWVWPCKSFTHALWVVFGTGLCCTWSRGASEQKVERSSVSERPVKHRDS